MAELVGGHTEQAPAARARSAKHDHRIFHPAHRTGDVDRRRVGVGEPLLAVVLDRVPHVHRGVGPVGVGVRRIVGLHQDGVPGARVPHEVGRGGPGHVPHVFGAEVPAEGRGRPGRPGRGLAGFVARDDRDRRVRVLGPGEARSLGRGQHLDRVEQRPGPGDDVVARHGDREVDVAILEVELALTKVLFGVPAADVVIHRQAGEPLRDLVQPAAPVLTATHAVGAVLGDLKRERDIPRRRATGRQRPVEVGAEHGAVDRSRERPADAGLATCGGAPHGVERRDGVAALEAAGSPPRVGGVDRAAAAVLAVDVLIHLQPGVAQRVGRVVGVADGLAAAGGVRRGVERHLNRVIGALLPVPRPRHSGAFADQVGRRQLQPSERGRVAHARWDTGRGLRRWGRRRLLQQNGKEQRSHGHRLFPRVKVATAA